MASFAANLLDEKDKGILIAIHEDLFYFLKMATGFALVPEPLVRTAPIMHFPGLQRFFKGQLVHIGKHENVFGLKILRDCRDETFFIKS